MTRTKKSNKLMTKKRSQKPKTKKNVKKSKNEQKKTSSSRKKKGGDVGDDISNCSTTSCKYNKNNRNYCKRLIKENKFTCSGTHPNKEYHSVEDRMKGNVFSNVQSNTYMLRLLEHDFEYGNSDDGNIYVLIKNVSPSDNDDPVKPDYYRFKKTNEIDKRLYKRMNTSFFIKNKTTPISISTDDEKNSNIRKWEVVGRDQQSLISNLGDNYKNFLSGPDFVFWGIKESNGQITKWGVMIKSSNNWEYFDEDDARYKLEENFWKYSKLQILNPKVNVQTIDDNPKQYIEDFFEYKKDDKVYAVIRNKLSTPTPYFIFEKIGKKEYKPTDNTVTIPESWCAVGKEKKDWEMKDLPNPLRILGTSILFQNDKYGKDIWEILEESQDKKTSDGKNIWISKQMNFRPEQIEKQDLAR